MRPLQDQFSQVVMEERGTLFDRANPTPEVEDLMTRRPRQDRMLRVAGLFAGIGGLEQGLARSGHRARLLCELDDAAHAVLQARIPGIEFHRDVSELESLPAEVDLLAAGFPCQDLSQAGMTRGIRGKHSGLVRHVFRLLQRKRVRWVLLENVPFMLQLGAGRALDYVLGELERLEYRWAYRIVDTRAFGLPQRRQRVLILASLDEDPRDVLLADDAGSRTEQRRLRKEAAVGFYWTEGVRGLGLAIDCVPTLKGGSTVGIPSPPAIWMPSGEIVKPDIRDAERLQGFEADWTKPAEAVAKRGARWKLVGNAVTVDVAHWVGARLGWPGNYEPHGDVALLRNCKWPAAAWNVDGTRHRSFVSCMPARKPVVPLTRFLRYTPQPLSAKATAGFYERFRRSTLYPELRGRFLSVLEGHLERMSAC